jgi:hypothetical protein
MSSAGLDALPAGVDGVEIKVTLDADQIEDGLAAFDLDRGLASRRQIWFCEHVAPLEPVALALSARGLILRLRSTDGKADSTLKLRGPGGGLDPESWRRRTRSAGKKAKIEGDWAGSRRLVSASLDGAPDNQRLVDVLGSHGEVSELFSGEQVELLREWLVPLEGLDVLGPIEALKWDRADRGLDDKIAAEIWRVDDGLSFLELSIRVEAAPAAAKQAFEALVRTRGFEIRVQDTKTKIVLERLAGARHSVSPDPPDR